MIPWVLQSEVQEANETFETNEGTQQEDCDGIQQSSHNTFKLFTDQFLTSNKVSRRVLSTSLLHTFMYREEFIVQSKSKLKRALTCLAWIKSGPNWWPSHPGKRITTI